MNIKVIVFRLFSSLYRRIHSWGVFILLVLLYLSSAGLKSDLALYLFGRIGLMSIHIFCGFVMFLIFIVMAHNRIIRSVYAGKKVRQVDIQALLGPNPLQGTGFRFAVDLVFYLLLLFISSLGLIYYFTRTTGFASGLIHQTSVFLFHAIAGWFFLSLALVKYYLTFINWYREVSAYLREH